MRALFRIVSQKSQPYYNPNYGYEPYWVGGEWAITDKEGDLAPKRSIPLVCGDECEPRFVEIKEVCGRDVWHRDYVSGCSEMAMLAGMCTGIDFDDYTRSFTTFSTYCKFLDAQCRGEVSERQYWTFVHVGKCEVNQNLIHKPVDKGHFMVTRKNEYFSKLNLLFVNMSMEPPAK